jgi:hypothetical protein
MPVRAWVGRFTLVDGQPQEEGAHLRSFPRQRPDEDEDELYVLAEPVSPASREYCGQLVDAVGRSFLEDTLSITGAVLRSLKAAHLQLRDWNQRTLREQHVTAGVSCVAVRDRTAYLAQVGPAVAYHLGDGRVARFVPEDDAAAPIGQADQIEPLFNRFDLSPGDLLVVANSRLDELVDQDTLRSILLKGADEALVDLFRIARGEQEFSLVLFACVVESEDVAQPVAAPLAEDSPGQPPAEPGRENGDLSAVAVPVAVVEPAATPDVAPTAAQAGAPPAGLTQPKVRLKGADAAVGYRRQGGLGARLPKVPPIAILGVAFLIVAGLLAWFFVPSALQESRDDEYTQLVEDAEEALAGALATDDVAVKRDLLREADAALAEAEMLQPDGAEAAQLRPQVDAAITDLNAVVELPELELVADVGEQIPGPVSSKDLALGGGGAYFVDQEQGRVIAVALVGAAAEPFVLFEAGDLVGSEIMGSPQNIAWAADQNALLVMDDARRLAAITPPGQPGRVLIVRDAAAWGSSDDMDYDGSLYVLDRNGDQVWRYPPTESGFDSEREPLVGSFEMEQALELAVGDTLYLVIGDDALARVSGGVGEMLSQAGIDVPLSSPGSLVPLPARDSLLVADRGHGRVVVFSLDGTFRQQWTSPRFTDLRAIAVDEQANLLYVLVGSALYRTPLPQLP